MPDVFPEWAVFVRHVTYVLIDVTKISGLFELEILNFGIHFYYFAEIF